MGSSIDIERRWGEHLRCLRGKRHTNAKLQNSYNKYGESEFEHRIVFECFPEEMIPLEQEEINKKSELNISPVAGNTLGRPVSDETRKRHSAARVETWKNPEYRQAQSVRMKKQAAEAWDDPMLRERMSKGISDAKRKGYDEGRLISPLVKLWKDDKYRESRSGNNNHNYNPTEYTFVSSDGEEFTGSMLFFQRHSGVNRSDINKLVSGKSRSLKGWKLKKAPEGA